MREKTKMGEATTAAANVNKQPSPPHIVMLPFMAHGHLIPFLALARQIHHLTNFTITIATTPLNIAYLRSTITNSSNQIHLIDLPFDTSAHNLPPNCENTESLPLSLIVSLFTASTSLETPVNNLIEQITADEGRPPLCIISDIFLGWANRVAEANSTVNISFTTGGAYGTAAYISIWQNLPHRKTDSDEFHVPGFPDSSRFHRSQLHPFIRAADGTDDWSLFFQPQIALSLQSFGWVCNTAEEIEPSAMEILRKYIKKPVWAVGPLLPPEMLGTSSPVPISNRHSGRKSGILVKDCLDWLETKEKRSVLYISFGSQNTIGETQMMELAKGLEKSGKPFIWVIRPPVGFDVKGEFKDEWLPERFEERITREKKQGLLVRGWAPQLEILKHSSIGGFLSHCGWNSAMESLSQGVPLIGWPLAAEQTYNVKMMVEEMGVCVELTRGGKGEIDCEKVEKIIVEVMEMEEMKMRAEKIRDSIRVAMEDGGDGKGSSLLALDDLILKLVSLSTL
ncbi:UDP-glycosyltransferase 92A1-like [Impatiens glandulifera]|uniref:UDP-glycosyltransferase 92A1-like n=1 Tax=Impatiens glandulifera TaxID=253017 RepID=UPI001FB05183|nr:UDP-glycosyltransferase 92A1-like [Impatiens glandulifera]